MVDGAFFFAVLPATGVPLSSVRGDFAAEKLDEALVSFRAVADPDVFHGPAVIVLPKFVLDSTVDLAPAFRAAGFPTGGFKEIFLGPEATLGMIQQRTRFSIDESGPGGSRLERRAEDSGAEAVRNARQFVCNRPFLFFVYHEPTRTVPVAGVYAGGGS